MMSIPRMSYHFCLGARPRVPRRAVAASAATLAATLAAASAAASSQDDEPSEPAVPPAASTVPADHFQQLFGKVNFLSQQQLQLDFATFRQQISYQHMELLAGQRRILDYFSYDPSSSSSQPPS